MSNRCHFILKSLYFAFQMRNVGRGISSSSSRDSPGGPGVRTLRPLQGSQVQPLVEDLRSCMIHGVAEKKSIPSSKLSKDIHSSTFLQNYLFPLKNFITHCHLASPSSTEVSHHLCFAKPKGPFGNSIGK